MLRLICISVNALKRIDPLMLKDRYLTFLKQSRISHIRMTLQLLFAEFLITHTYVMRCAIWYHLYCLKNVKNTHGGVLILMEEC